MENLLEQARAVLFDDLPKQEILAFYSAGRGKEIESGKFTNPSSSSALVANAFGYFIDEPHLLCLPGVETATKVALEQELRFPWRGGLHPWLDVVVETEHQLVGIESKRYEPFREKKGLFSEAFQRDVWRAGMLPFKNMRDELSQGYLHLDPVQLTKHAFALSTQAAKQEKKPTLIYLHAEPATFPDGAAIRDSEIVRHRSEVQRYAEAVADAEVRFMAMTYNELLNTWRSQAPLQSHAERLQQVFSLSRE